MRTPQKFALPAEKPFAEYAEAKALSVPAKLVLIGPFLRSGRIRIREKIMAVLVLAFLMISCNCNVLNYIWHGFHFPNMLPYRFSFLFSFALLTVGYRAFLVVLEEKCRVWDLLAMLAVTVGVF